MSDYVKIHDGDWLQAEKQQCDDCGKEIGDWYWADNNATRIMQVYCPNCEERRSERYGCAMILSEGVMCQDGACGCGGTGVY